MTGVVDGFWLPRSLRQKLIGRQTPFASMSFVNGRECAPDIEGAVTAHWPIFDADRWNALLSGLQEQRSHVPRGLEFWERFEKAMGGVGRRFADPSDALTRRAMETLPSYTGFSPEMIRFTLGALDLMTLAQFPPAFSFRPRAGLSQTGEAWQTLPGMPGRMRFFSSGGWKDAIFRLAGRRELFHLSESPELLVGYGAGNVPGTALLIAMLSQAIGLAGVTPPAAVVKNSRREPIFSALVLDAVEEFDPELFGSVAVLAWDYADLEVQKLLLPRADLVIAAASDETIAQIQGQIQSMGSQGKGRARFHPHGHKVSFAAISRQVLRRGLVDADSGQPLLDVVTLLAALDSIFWDQYGCLSARMHFFERGGEGDHSEFDYAERLVEQLRLLAGVLPRGAWPRQRLQDTFDRLTLLEKTGQVQVLSAYEDDFVVAVDGRSYSQATFQALVNSCLGRVIIVRPIDAWMQIPDEYLRMLPPANLQSLSVALGAPGEETDVRFLEFAEACGRRGVTAIRSLGRGAFPQLAYSWDGFIPFDLVASRPEGHFTSIEFDKPLDEILATYHLFLEKGMSMRVGEE
jgi:hypothetical protein